jgi:hypothetical protein
VAVVVALVVLVQVLRMVVKTIEELLEVTRLPVDLAEQATS